MNGSNIPPAAVIKQIIPTNMPKKPTNFTIFGRVSLSSSAITSANRWNIQRAAKMPAMIRISQENHTIIQRISINISNIRSPSLLYSKRVTGLKPFH
ncbi:MAG: hypothetical protein ACTSRU_02030 [Candidatus Hodarchaeales archaeon]